MPSSGLKPSQSSYRPWAQHSDNADNAIGHDTSQPPDDPELMPDDEDFSTGYAGYAEPADYAGADCDEGEGPDEDEYQGDGDMPPAQWFHASHTAYDGNYHPIAHPSTQGQPTSTYLSDNSDVSDGGGGPVAPINYLSIASILTDDVDMEEVFDATGEFDPFGEHTTGYHQYPPHGDVDGLLFGAHPAASPWGDPGDDVPAPQPASVASHSAEELQQQLDQLGPGDEFEDGSTVWFPVPAPPAFVSPNMSNLHPANYGLVEFLQQWSLTGARKSKGQGRFPWPQRVMDLSHAHLTHVQYADLVVDECDIQGIDWRDLGVTRRDARERRRLTYRNYTNQEGSDISPVRPPPKTTCLFGAEISTFMMPLSGLRY